LCCAENNIVEVLDRPHICNKIYRPTNYRPVHGYFK